MEDEDVDKPGPLLLGSVFLLLTIVASVIGAVVGQQVMGEGFERRQAETSEQEEVVEAEPTPIDGKTRPVRLEPIVTNLSDPSDVWIRIESVLVLDIEAPDPEILAKKVSEDMLAFLRTVSLPELQGASGLLHLKEDLNDRALIRDDDAVHELIIESLVLQ